MKNILAVSLVILGLLSCNKNHQNTEKKEDIKGVFQDEESLADSTLSASKNCYIRSIGNDTVYAKIENNLGTITGQLYYKNHQKDSSFGDIIGFLDGDTIKVEYTFQSERETSVRPIWFLIKDKKIIEGIGKYENLDLKNTINFDDENIFENADCSLVETTLSNVFVKFQSFVNSKIDNQTVPQNSINKNEINHKNEDKTNINQNLNAKKTEMKNTAEKKKK